MTFVLRVTIGPPVVLAAVCTGMAFADSQKATIKPVASAPGWTIQTVRLRGNDLANNGPTRTALIRSDGEIFTLYGGRFYVVDSSGARRARISYSCANAGVSHDSSAIYCVTPSEIRVITPHGSTQIAFRERLSPPFAVDVRGRSVTYAAGGRIVDRNTSSERTWQDGCVGYPVVLRRGEHAIAYADGYHVGIVSAGSEKAACIARPAPDVPFRGAPEIIALPKDTFALIYAGVSAVYLLNASAHIERVALPFSAISAARDQANNIWIVVATKMYLRSGLCKLRPHGSVQCYDLPLSAAGPISVDPRGPLWISAGFLHAFSVAVPPKGGA